ncbi:MAG: hypothetical protein P4M12_12190 [Gammaproteobacteria bacterium]|nr:hypothetical protein [Gammaproteobacteria bacterium]
MTKEHKHQEKLPDFSVVLGGPLYQLYLRTRLVKPALDLCGRRIVVICMFTWLPLLLLTIIGGAAFNGVETPFLFDIEMHTRLLGSLALLIAAEPIVHRLLQIAVVQFLERDIITEENRSTFNSFLSSAMRLRNSVAIELFLVFLVLTVGHLIWATYAAPNMSTWSLNILNDHLSLTPAGYWYVFISLPIFQFILIRWYFRMFIWYRFLWQLSRLPLHINSLHPDKAAGLGFLGNSVLAFGMVFLAHTILLAGLIANRIWHTGATLIEFKLEIFGMIAYLMLLAFVPLFFFSTHLMKARLNGLRAYGNLASGYVNDFSRKWMKTDSKNNEPILGTSDLQSLADLSNSFQVASQVSLVPLNRGIFLQLLILTALPLFPLVLTLIPLESMIKNLFKVIF